MFRQWKAPAIAALALLSVVPAASAQRRVIIYRGVGPGWYYPYRYGWGWGWGPAYAPQPTTGDVKLVNPMKGTSLYVDGGYAGQADKMKRFSLPPGTHRIEVRSPDGRTIIQESVQVILGKTVRVNAA